MKTILVTKIIGGGPVDGSLHLKVEQEGTNEAMLLVIPDSELDAFSKISKPTAEKAKPTKGGK